jgi:hypothetical protein
MGFKSLAVGTPSPDFSFYSVKKDHVSGGKKREPVGKTPVAYLLLNSREKREEILDCHWITYQQGGYTSYEKSSQERAGVGATA